LRELLIADAGPLIALARIDRLWLLPRIFSRTMTSKTVWSECLAGLDHRSGHLRAWSAKA
jgi:predicted nucleic acid-binding protein